MFGRIKFFNEVKGFGFIEAEGDDGGIFFHVSRIADKHEKLAVGMVVRFDLAPPIRLGQKDQAVNVHVVHEKPTVDLPVSRGGGR